jgi:cyanophycin synthetase
LTRHGSRVGMTTTSGIYVDGQLVTAVDASGPKSARIVLGDPTVSAAVLETARGGILREGLAFDRADVGVVLNVTADHLGLKGVNNLEDLARVKGVVARNVRRRGTTVLNADDPHTRAMARYAGGRVAFFTTKAVLDDQLDEHIRSGGLLARLERTADRMTLWLHDRGTQTLIMDAAEIPATIGGAAVFNVQNALAAATAAHAQGVPMEDIRAALRTFDSSFEQNPGRMNITTAPGFTTILDYAHNPAAMVALGEVVSHLRPHHDRVIGVVSVPGDRRDDDIRELGRIAATVFDDLVFRERPDGRGRTAGGVIALLFEGAIAAGMREQRILRVMDEHDAVQTALELARPNDLVVISPTEVTASWNQIQDFALIRQKREKADAGSNPYAQSSVNA